MKRAVLKINESHVKNVRAEYLESDRRGIGV